MESLSNGPTQSLPSTNGSQHPCQSQQLLIDTMQLVAPRTETVVPNHILNSKIYSKVAQNSIVQAAPAVVHFSGFEIGKLQQQTLRLVNVSTDVQRMHVLPPQTKYFKIKYTKKERLVPGLSLDCILEFIPDEWRYYYDCVRIHCKGEENLVIPVHAYPVMSTANFPEIFNFPPIPVGHRTTQIIPLSCHTPIDFEYQLTYLQPHPAFTVDPMSGMVPANGSVQITVSFSPTEFSTCHMKLQLVISQFNSKPLVCTFTGSSAPGLAKELGEKEIQHDSDSGDSAWDSLLDPRSITPVDLARNKRSKARRTGTNGRRHPVTTEEIEAHGLIFPKNLDTPHAVAQVLNQKPGELQMKELRKALSKKGATAGTRQMKKKLFADKVSADVYEERQNQLRWQTKIGADAMTSQQKLAVLDEREDAWAQYKIKRGDPVLDVEYERHKTKMLSRKTIRAYDNLPGEDAMFDTYTNDLWAARYSSIDKFQQAARKIIVRTRATKKLNSLRQTVINWKNRKIASTTQRQTEITEQEEEAEEQDSLIDSVVLKPEQIKSFSFPTYVPPNVKDDMAVDALGVVPYQTTVLTIKHKATYFNLKVPQQYQLMGYRQHDVHAASSGYVSPHIVKQLRTGAQEEIVTLPESSHVGMDVTPLVNEEDMVVEDVGETPTPHPHTGDDATAAPPPAGQAETEMEPLVPPPGLFKPVEHHPLHIFNPAPGLQVFQNPLPYSEIDSDFHLCPAPRYTSNDTTNPHKATQKHYLDKKDVVKGIMAWKKFPSQGLVSLSNTPTLTNVWVPRWSDPFGSELLPTEDTPPLLSALPEDDVINVKDGGEEEGDEDEAITLTPEMVAAKYPAIDVTTAAATTATDKNKQELTFPHGNKMPSTNIPVGAAGPVPREKREQELELFLKRKYNRLGKKFSARVKHYNNLKTTPKLILK